VFVSRVSQAIEYKRRVNGSMLSSRLLNYVSMFHVSQTRDYKRGVNIYSTFSLWYDSHGTRTHHLTDAGRACYHFLYIYRLLNDVFVSRVSQTRDNKCGVNGSMLSLHLLNNVFVSRESQTIDYKRGVNGNMLYSRLHSTDARRACYHLFHVYSLWFDSHGTRTHHLKDARRRVSQTIDYKRGVNGGMLSSRLLNDVFLSPVSQTIDYKRGVNGSMLSSRLLNDLTHTGDEHII
jgi:hypothetical protein